MGATGSVLEEAHVTKASTNSVSTKKSASTSSSPSITFPVSLAFWSNVHIKLPEQFLLRISYESLDFVNAASGLPLVQFPFQNIICWGSSLTNFQFKVFDLENDDPEKRTHGIMISVNTRQGKAIEDATMATVQKLMVDINARAISREEFSGLLNTVFDTNNMLAENWMEIVNQFTVGGRLFLAKQGMELLIRVGKEAPFEKVELACLIYERMINKNSVQLIINTFDDEQERGNLIHRLKLNSSKSGTTTAVTNCAILPEKLV